MPGDATPASQQQLTSIEPAVLRGTMSAFATGVAVITTEYGGEPHGMTVNSLTCLSLDPPLLLVCFMKDAGTAAAVTGRNAFVVNFLSQTQEYLAEHFAARGPAHFDGLTIHRNHMGLPYIPNSLGRLDCTIEATHPGGDHIIVIGRVVACEAHEGAPLIFYQGHYHGLTDQRRPAAHWQR